MCSPFAVSAVMHVPLGLRARHGVDILHVAHRAQSTAIRLLHRSFAVDPDPLLLYQPFLQSTTLPAPAEGLLAALRLSSASAATYVMQVYPRQQRRCATNTLQLQLASFLLPYPFAFT